MNDVNGTLIISRVQQTDAGSYICLARSNGVEINATIKIDVIVSPKIVVKPENVTKAYAGYPLTMHCQADGEPTPTVQWDKNGILNGFDPRRFRALENGTLYIAEIQFGDEGNYGCTAGNAGGFKREEVQLLVFGRLTLKIISPVTQSIHIIIFR
jgi:PTK7 protein tyrosine kinase 7